ncbi:MAG: YgiT-type zinc finger protein [Methylococcaceae bacterium]|nr:MAG: YgiT-type zinc finger protein [Methylococcaceae bacterium]
MPTCLDESARSVVGGCLRAIRQITSHFAVMESGFNVGILRAVAKLHCIECDYCGEQYFDADVLKAIELEHLAILRQQKVPKRIRPAAMETFAELTA